MSEIEQKALSLHGRLRMAAACPDPNAPLLAEAADAIKQHEAFRRDVSDAVEEWIAKWQKCTPSRDEVRAHFARFIIPQPDPIAEAWIEATGNTVGMEPLNAALAARGLKIVEDK